jgi:glycosyltransferase involved in cell wall biosynthesis
VTRVLFLAESYFPILGGGERHIRILATRLAASGMPALVLTRRSQAVWPADEVLDGVRVVRVRPSGAARVGKYLMILPALAALRRLRGQYDLIVVRGTRVLGLPAVLMARWLGKPIVLQSEISGELSGEVYTWGTALAGGIVDRLVRRLVVLRNRVLRRADGFIAISRPIEREYLAAGVPERKLTLIPHGVDVDRFRPAAADERQVVRARLGLPAEGIVAVYTGRLLRGKGLEVLLDAFARVAHEEPRAHLMIVGSGSGQALSCEDELQRRARESDLAGRVTFIGRVDDVSEHLRASDLYTFPSFFEALPLAVIEAAATGLAIVATSVGGIPDVIANGESGVLIEPGDATVLAEALLTLIRDPERQRALGERARAVARSQFALNANIDRYREYFSRSAAR